MKPTLLARLVLATVLGVGVGAAFPAHATSLADLSVDAMTDASTWIVEGEVLDVWPEVDEDGDIWTRARVRVDARYKGPALGDEIVVDTRGGRLGQAVQDVASSPRYSVGEKVILFLSEVDFGRRITTVGMELGKFTVRRPAGERRTIAQRAWVPFAEVYDHRFVPYPAPDHRLYTDDLLGAVESRLDVGWQGDPIPGISPTRLAEINTPERRLRR